MIIGRAATQRGTARFASREPTTGLKEREREGTVPLHHPVALGRQDKIKDSSVTEPSAAPARRERERDIPGKSLNRGWPHDFVLRTSRREKLRGGRVVIRAICRKLQDREIIYRNLAFEIGGDIIINSHT